MDTPTYRKRFYSKVKFQWPSACYVWRGATGISGNKKYGLFSYYDRLQGAHRVALKLHGVEVPDDSHVHHKCGNTLCVRVDHLEVKNLEVKTPKEHSDEHPERRRGINNSVKTHCPHGHLYDDFNTYMWRGKRMCRICAAARRQAYQTKRKLEKNA